MRKRVSQPDVSQPVPGRPRPLGYGSGLAPGVTPANSNTRISAAALPRQPQAPVPSSGGNLGLNSDRLRHAMVQRLRAQGISDERVLNAMAAVPRHLFVDEALASRALRGIGAAHRPFTDHFQPWVVARMISAVCGTAPRPSARSGGRLRLSGRGAGQIVRRFTASNASAVCTNWRAITCARAAPDDPHPPDLWNGTVGLPGVSPFDAIVVAAAGLAIRRRCCSSSRREDG